jgi:hypothetical protein
MLYSNSNLDPYFVRCVAGDELPTAEFVDNGDGTATDNVTGLTWQKDQYPASEWETALNYCENLQLDGHNDWRLPNIRELESIRIQNANYCSWDTAIFGGDCYLVGYWSSTTMVGDPHEAHGMYFWGISTESVSGAKTGGDIIVKRARCVRGGIDTQDLPNLTPYQPNGWSDKVVVSTSPDTHMDSSLVEPTDTLFIDWAVINDGLDSVPAGVRFELYLQGDLIGAWKSDSEIEPSHWVYVSDYEAGPLDPGTYELRIEADSEELVTESEEGDNRYTKYVTIFPAADIDCLDIDGNGSVDALTDGLLSIRYEFGFRGQTLIEGAVGSGCTRCTAQQIEAYLGGLML